jgi:hypothetical protein
MIGMDYDRNYPELVPPPVSSYGSFDSGIFEYSPLPVLLQAPSLAPSQAAIYSQASMSSQGSNVSTGKFIGSIEEINAAQKVEVNGLLNVISKLLSLNNLIEFLRPKQVAAFTENKEELTQTMMELASKDYVWPYPYPQWFVNGIKSNIEYEDFTKFKESLTFEFIYPIDYTMDMSVIVNDLEKLVRDSLSNSLEFMEVYGIERPSPDLPIDEFDASIKDILLTHPFFKSALGQKAITELADNNTHILPAMINRLLVISGEVVDLGVPFNADRFGLLHNSIIPYFFKMIIELKLIVESTQDGKSVKRMERLNFLEKCAESKERIALYNEMCEYMSPHNKEAFMFVSLSGGNLITIFAKLLKALKDLDSLLNNTTDARPIDDKIQDFISRHRHYYEIFTRFTRRYPELFKTAKEEDDDDDDKLKTKKQRTREFPIITSKFPIITSKSLTVIQELTKDLVNLDALANKSFSDVDIKLCCLDSDKNEKSYTPSNIESIPLGIQQCKAYYEKFLKVAKDAGQYTTFFLARNKSYHKIVYDGKNITPELEQKLTISLGKHLKILKRNCINGMKKSMKKRQYTDKFTLEDIEMIENMLTSQMYEERLKKFERGDVKDIPGISNCIRYLKFLLLKKNSTDETTRQNIELLRKNDDNTFIDKLIACSTAGNECIYEHFNPINPNPLQREKIKKQPLRLGNLNKEYYRYFATLDSMVISKKGAFPKLASDILLKMITVIDMPFERKDIMSLPFIKVEGSYSNTDTWKSAHTKIIEECEEKFKSTNILPGYRFILVALNDKKHSASAMLKLSQSMLKSQKPKLQSSIAKKSKFNVYELEKEIPDAILTPTITYDSLDFQHEDEIFPRYTTESPGNPIIIIGNPGNPIIPILDGGNKTMKSKKHKTKKSKKSRKHKTKKPKKSRKSRKYKSKQSRKSRKHKSKKPQKSIKPKKTRKQSHYKSLFSKTLKKHYKK